MTRVVGCPFPRRVTDQVSAVPRFLLFPPNPPLLLVLPPSLPPPQHVCASSAFYARARNGAREPSQSKTGAILLKSSWQRRKSTSCAATRTRHANQATSRRFRRLEPGVTSSRTRSQARPGQTGSGSVGASCFWDCRLSLLPPYKSRMITFLKRVGECVSGVRVGKGGSTHPLGGRSEKRHQLYPKPGLWRSISVGFISRIGKEL